MKTLSEMVQELEYEYEKLSKRYQNLYQRYNRRGVIIATKVLGWKKYICKGSGQPIYGPSQEAVDAVEWGGTIYDLIDEAIDKMEIK